MSAMLVEVGSVTVSHEEDIAALQSEIETIQVINTNQTRRINDVEDVNATQATAISTIQSINTSQQTQITALEQSVAKLRPVHQDASLSNIELTGVPMQDATWVTTTHVHCFNVVTAGTYLLTAQITLQRLPAHLTTNEVKRVQCKFLIRDNATQDVLSTSQYVGLNYTEVQPTAARHQSITITLYEMYNSTSPADIDLCIASNVDIKGATGTEFTAVIKVLRVYDY